MKRPRAVRIPTGEPDLGFGVDRWVPVREAARIAGVDPRTIRRWADSGQIMARLTPGGHRQISLAGLGASYSSAQRVGSDTPIDVEPDAALPEWTASAALWHLWRPPRRLSDDDVARLRLDAEQLVRILTELRETLTGDLAERDRRAEAASPTYGGSW